MFSRKQTLNVLILYVKSTYDFLYESSNLKSKNISFSLRNTCKVDRTRFFFAQTGKEKHKGGN